MNRRTFWFSTLALVLAAPLLVIAQEQGDAPPVPPPGEQGGPGGRGGPGGPGGFNPEEFRKRMMERMQEELGTTAEEMQVLQPKIEKVMTAQRDARGGMGMGFGGGRGGRGGGRGGRDGGPGGFGGGGFRR